MTNEKRSSMSVDDSVSFKYEGQLDDLFWNDYPKKLFVLGDIGSGKSTLIKYYLRCFCPNSGQHKDDFKKKLIIYLDAIDYPYVAESADNFYHYVKDAIEATFKEVGLEIEPYIKKRSLHGFNIREWVRYALEEISQLTHRPAPNIPFKYLVFVLDNLDQCTLDVQKNLLAIVDGWSRLRTINIWRIIVPMWPYTHAKLKLSDFKPARDGIEIVIPQIHTEGMFEKRKDALAMELEKMVLPDTEKHSISEYFDVIHSAAIDIFHKKIARLCGSNVRKKLLLWGDFLSGERAQSIYYESSSLPTSRRSFDYAILDAVLCGCCESFRADPQKILNIFNVLGVRSSDYDILIGLHGLWLLHQKTTDEIDFQYKMLGLGYAKEKIVGLERRFAIAGLFYEVPTGSGHQLFISYNLCDEVITAFLDLIFEPAYVDNAALVTPVDLETVKSLRMTRGDRPELFYPRAMTTFCFLDHLKACEDRFLHGVHISDADLEKEHKQKLRALCVPSFSAGIAKKYKQRIRAIQDSGLLRHMSTIQWNEILSRLASIDPE